MAEFTDDDKRILDMLRKALERRSSTLPTLQPWQEGTAHQSAILSDKGSVPADVVRGFSGSWAASYAYDRGGSVTSSGAIDTQVHADTPSLPARVFSTRLGQAGVPEINFPPFHANTNAFGPKGPALIGSPISFEVVGPTLKSPACDWTWEVSLETGPNLGDELIMSVRADGAAPTCATIADAYNLTDFTMGDINEPNGGLYLIISDDGTGGGALPAGVTPLTPLDGYRDSAKYEIFRVSSIVDDTIELHPNKPLRDFFNPVANLGVKGIMLVRPYATRLAALPSQRRGREQNFAVIPPQRSASPDTYPPYDGGVVGDKTWLQGGFTELTAPGSGNVVGSSALYMGRQSIPIPIPISEFFGEVEIGAGTVPAGEVGTWIVTLPAPAPADLIRRVIHIYQVSRVDEDSKFLYGSTQACLGYFEVRSVAGNNLTLTRVPETDPVSGRTFYGPGPYVQIPVLGTRKIEVYFTVHRVISDLFLGPISADDIEACRLAPLLAPSWTERSAKQRTSSVTGLPPGSNRSKPDKAIFNTSTYTPPAGGLPDPSDPGNLLDLGFRMVLFPAKADPGTGQAVADFSRPITSREVIIDPTVTDTQYLEVDYDAGMVRLSHTPPAIAGGDIVPNGVIAGGNVRGEVILFACLVPYTLEASQRGMGPAITTGTGGSFSVTIQANISEALTNYDPAPPYFTASNVIPNPVEIVLDQVWRGPPTGVVEIVEGGVGGRSFGLWSYTNTRTVTTGFALVTTFSLIASSPQAIDPTPGTGETRTVILRREVVQGVAAPTLTHVVDDYLNDRAYGQALRASAIRLPRDRVFLDPDGATRVEMGPAFSWAEKTMGLLSPSRLPFPPLDPTLATPVEHYFGESGLFCGMDYEVPAGDPRAPTPGGPFRRWSEGTSIELAATQPAINWHGIRSYSASPPEGGLVRLNQGWRLSARFKFELDSLGQRATMFIGFVQNENGVGIAPSVDEATQGAGMDQELSAVGLYISGSLGKIQFWGRGSDGAVATDRFIDTGIPAGVTDTTVGPYTFVMETLPYPSVAVRYGLFDETGRLLSTARISLRTHLPGVLPTSNGLFFIAGVRINGELPPVMLQIYHISLALRFGEFDLPFLP